MLRVHGSGGTASLATLLMVWLLAPVTAAAGWLLLRRIIFDHIDRVTPNRESAIALRIVGACALLAMTALAIFVLPGRGTSRCPSCEQSLLSLLVLNQLQVYAEGGIAGYIACMLAKLRTLPALPARPDPS